MAAVRPSGNPNGLKRPRANWAKKIRCIRRGKLVIRDGGRVLEMLRQVRGERVRDAKDAFPTRLPLLRRLLARRELLN